MSDALAILFVFIISSCLGCTVQLPNSNSYTFNSKQSVLLDVAIDGRVVGGAHDRGAQKTLYQGWITVYNMTTPSSSTFPKPWVRDYLVTSADAVGRWLFLIGYADGVFETRNPNNFATISLMGDRRGSITGAVGLYNNWWQRAFLIISSTAAVNVWDPAGRDGSQPVYSLASGVFNAIALFNGSLVLVGDQSGRVSLYDPYASRNGGKLLWVLPVSSSVTSLLALDGSSFVVGFQNQNALVFRADRNGYQQINALTAPSAVGNVNALALFCDGTVATGHSSGNILFWNPSNTSSPFISQLPKSHTCGINSLAVLQDNSLVSSACDFSVKLWKAQSNVVAYK